MLPCRNLIWFSDQGGRFAVNPVIRNSEILHNHIQKRTVTGLDHLVSGIVRILIGQQEYLILFLMILYSECHLRCFFCILFQCPAKAVFLNIFFD